MAALGSILLKLSIIIKMSLPQGLVNAGVSEVPRYLKTEAQVAQYRYQQEYDRRNSDHMAEDLHKSYWEATGDPILVPHRHEFDDTDNFHEARRDFLIHVLQRQLIADLKRNDALRGRVATGALSPSALVEMGADDRCREDRKRKAPPPVVEEEILAEGYVCETCGSTRITCATESRPTTSYGTSEFRQILFLDCLDCGRSWQED